MAQKTEGLIDTPPDQDQRLLAVVMHTCAVCGHAFPYRYVGYYRADSLQPIDFVCRACFPLWHARWAIAHGWLVLSRANPTQEGDPVARRKF